MYISQPRGFIVKEKENYICTLNKALYRLHQNKWVWNFEINKVLLDSGFEKFEWCNYVQNFRSNSLLLIYVDDIVIFGKTDKHINKVLNFLKR